jgi:hypothetical protein
MNAGTLLRAAWLAVLVPLSCLFATTAAMAATPASGDVAKGSCAGCGTVSGEVVEVGTGTPIAGALVRVYDLVGGPTFDHLTDADGRFDTGALLPAGSYRAEVHHPSHVTTLHGDVACSLTSCDPALGAPIAVTAGGSTVANVSMRRGAQLGGTVTFPAGTPPFIGVTIVALTTPGQMDVLMNPADGRWQSNAVLPAGDYRVRTANTAGLIDEAWPDIICEGRFCEGQGQTITLAEGEASNGVDFELVAGGTIQGTVTAGGVPVASTTVYLISAGGTYERLAFTGPDGSYASGTGLVPGTWHALVAPDATRVGEVWPEQPCVLCIPDDGGPITVTASASAGPIDFTLESGGRIRGRVLALADATPIPNASLTFHSLDRGRNELVQPNAPDGSYQSLPLPAGSYTVAASAPGYVVQVLGVDTCPEDCQLPDGTPLTVSNGGAVENVDIALSTGSGVAGILTDPEGNPVANATVYLEDGNDTYFSAPSAVDGSYEVISVPAGRYRALVFPFGHLMRTSWPDVPCVVNCFPEELPHFDLETGVMRDDIDIQIQRGGVIEGHVTAAAGGAPLQGVRVHVLVATDDAPFAAEASTDASGYYRTEAVPPAAYFVRTIGDDSNYIDEAFDDVYCFGGCDNDDLTPRVLAAGGTATADFALDLGGRISGKLTRASDGQGLGSPRPVMLFLDPAGAILDVRFVFGSDGSYISGGMPAGNYYVRSRNRIGFLDELFDDVSCYWCVPPPGNAVAVAAGSITANVNLALASGARLGGAITHEDGGDPASGVSVDVHDANGRLVTSGSVTAGGAWRSNNALPPGAYYLSTRSNGRYRDESYGGQACSGACVPPSGTPVVVFGTTDVNGLDFALAHLPVFRHGFEDTP